MQDKYEESMQKRRKELGKNVLKKSSQELGKNTAREVARN